MMMPVKFAAGLLAVSMVAACAVNAAGTPSPAAQACLRDVTRTTNNGDVVLISEKATKAGTKVIVGVGPQRAHWSCVGYPDGTTSNIESQTDEGGL